MGRRAALLSTLLLASALHQVLASGVFELRLTAFTNDLGRDDQGNCCSGHRTDRGTCSGVCRTLFRVCLKHYQATIDFNSPCTFGEVITPVLGNNTLHLLDQNIPGFLNPVRFGFDFSWPGTFSLIVEAWHESESDDIRGRSRTLIARLATQRWQAVQPDWTQDVHSTNHTTLYYAYRVMCDANYYGDGCAKLCRPRDDTFGHYTCSATGEQLCKTGWSGEYCTTALCLPGCNEMHGYCDQPHECKCRIGWQGHTCDQCIRYPGCLHGTCNQPWQCNCNEGWGGLFCNQDLNYCTTHNPCKNQGTCTNTGQGSYTCTCPESFTGTNCDVQIDDCVQQPCLNGGTCRSGDRNYTCECTLGFFGRHCETSASTCTENPCRNGGTCLDGPTGYSCTCLPGYEGVNCERRKNDCEPNPCLHGGSCVDRLNSFSCICPTGYTGDHCELDIDDCVENPCLNGGSCIDHVNFFRCLCVPGFVGTLCQTNVDDCLTKPCANGGSCHDLINDYGCSCQDGFAGKDCSVNVDECSSSPCKNGATCEDLVNEFLCHCLAGYSGSLCDRVAVAVVHSSSSSRGLASNGSHMDSGAPPLTPPHRSTGPFNSTAAVEVSHPQIAEESTARLSGQQVALIAALSAAVPVAALVAVLVILFLRQRKRRRRLQQDEEVRKQNEHNAFHSMNNKWLDKQIVNTLDRPVPKALKVTNEDHELCRDQLPVHRTKSGKLLNTDCGSSVCHHHSSSSSKLMDTSCDHSCLQRTSARRENTLPTLPDLSAKSEAGDRASRSSIYVIEDHFPSSREGELLATEV